MENKCRQRAMERGFSLGEIRQRYPLVFCECLQVIVHQSDTSLAYEISPMYRESRLAEIRSLQFASGALVFLSACSTARTGHSVERCSPHGIVTVFFEAGAATVIGTLWPVEGIATALVAHWFYRCWRIEGKGRLESLNEATTRLREVTRAECEQILAVSERLRLRGEKPFADEYHWGSFVLYGAW